tara:strand:- start:1097 stop:1825 length:729 start_codon:yes stop_codon:yes gene_type:complete
MADINHKIDNDVDRIKDTEEKVSIQRVKKPRTQKQIDATKKMLEGRRKWAVEKGKENKQIKVNKLKDKISKIEGVEASNDLEDKEDISHSLYDPEALYPNIEENVIEEDDTPPNVLTTAFDEQPPLEENNIEEAVESVAIAKANRNASKSTPKGKKKKVKQIVNNYHYTASIDESSEDEEIVNNYYIPEKKKKLKKVKKKKEKKYITPPPSSSSSEDDEYYDNPSMNGFSYQTPPKNMFNFV